MVGLASHALDSLGLRPQHSIYLKQLHLRREEWLATALWLEPPIGSHGA
jgi:hypothetical protein